MSPYYNAAKTGEQASGAPTQGQAALSAAAAKGGTPYLEALYANSQSVNNIGNAGYDPTTGQPQTPAGGAQSLILGQGQPGIAQSGLTMAQLMASIGMTGATAQNSAMNLADQLEFGLAGNAITAGQQDIQGQGLAAQLGNAQTQQGIEEAQYGLQTQQYPEQQAQAALANKNAVQQMSSQGAISGTLNTEGHKAEVSTQAQQYGWQQADIARAQANAALGQKGEQAGYQYSVGDIARSEQNLKLAAAANGLSTEQLKSQFGQGLSALGIQGDPTQLYTQYLAQQSGQLGTLGQSEGQAGLLVPGSALMNAGTQGGLNLNSLFSGVG